MLLSPLEPERFRAFWAYWEVDAIARFTAAPFNMERFRLINRGKTLQPKLYLDRTGAFQEEAFRQLRAGGASLALGNFENYSNSTLALSRELETEFRCPVQVNLYVTPAGAQGLGSHVDPHDVLILQVAGRKTWSIFEGPNLDAPHSDIVLPPGGWLFLPKGARHDVRNLGAELSVHLTIGFHPLTWGEVFDRSLRDARVAQPALNAPLRVGDDMSASSEELTTRLKSLLAFVDIPVQAAKYYANFPALAVRVPFGRDIARGDLDAISEDTPLAWCDDAAMSIGGSAAPELSIPYRRIPLVFQAKWADVLREIRLKNRFVPKQLTVEGQSSVLLCRFLAGVGALQTDRLKESGVRSQDSGGETRKGHGKSS